MLNFLGVLGVLAESSDNKFPLDLKIEQLCTRSDDDAVTLQEELSNLCEWFNKWMIKFSTDKCSVLDVGSNTPPN